ncbi:hypothetical protein Ancab_010640, partial [Ancistrocladus abbreviatus]
KKKREEGRGKRKRHPHLKENYTIGKRETSASENVHGKILLPQLPSIFPSQGPFLPPVCPPLPLPSWVGFIVVASNWTSTVNDASSSHHSPSSLKFIDDNKEEKDENEEQPKPITLYELLESSGFRDEEREEKRRSTKAAVYETHEIRKNFEGSKS